jgi:hypothetical protein
MATKADSKIATRGSPMNRANAMHGGTYHAPERQRTGYAEVARASMLVEAKNAGLPQFVSFGLDEQLPSRLVEVALGSYA